jgi:hypothetical protein
MVNKVDGAVLRKIEKNKTEIQCAYKGERVKLFIHAHSGNRIYKTSSSDKSTLIKFTKNAPIKEPSRSIERITLPEIKPKGAGKEEVLVKVYSTEDGEDAFNSGANKVFYNLLAEDYSSRFGAYVPRILNDQEVEQVLSLIETHQVKDILIGDLGVYLKLRNKKGLNLYLDYSNNIFNDYDLEFFNKATSIISPELSFWELKEFQDKSFVVLIQGRVVLMNTKYLSLPRSLKDEKRYAFPVRKEHTYLQVLNSVELGLFEGILALRKNGINKFFLDLDTDVGFMVKQYVNILKGKKLSIDKENYTKGHWDKGVE